MLSRRIVDAQTAYNYISGVINVFKPAGVKVSQCRNAILGNVCKDLNELIVREPRKLKIGSGGSQTHIYGPEVDLSDHTLSVGPRYEIKDIRCACASHLGHNTSGVLIFGLNRGARTSIILNKTRPIRVYHITGRFGISTETHFRDSRVTLRATHDHIFVGKLNGMLASMQASHQKKMFELSGVDMQSQVGFELASRGLIRPASHDVPLIYGIRCIQFQRPEFTLEVHALNETEAYLSQLVHEIGIEMKSCAHCVSIRCIRQGHFNIEQSLLRRDWTLQGVISNMSQCKTILNEHPEMLRRTDPKIGTE